MNQRKTDKKETEELNSIKSKEGDVLHSEDFNDFIFEEAKMKESDVLIPRTIPPKPILSLTLDKHSNLIRQQF